MERLDGRIAPRSGLASKYFIDTGAGVIDADYRGQVKVLLFNHAETDFDGMCAQDSRGSERRAECIIDYFIVKEGDRVAQLILERVREAFEPDWWWIWKVTSRIDIYPRDCRGRGAGREPQSCWWLWEHGIVLGPWTEKHSGNKLITVG